MSRVLEFADEVAGLTPGLDQAQTITNDFTTTANKNSVFFGSITFDATNPVTVVANSELIFHDADVDFKQGFNIQGTLNWITGGGTTDKDVSGLQINGTTVIDSNRNISNVPLIQATQATIGTNALVVSSDGKVGIGTSSPSQTLSVRNGSDNQIRVENGASATQSYEFGRNGTTGLLTFYGNQTGYTGYVFSGVDGERMRINANGDVDIKGDSGGIILNVQSQTTANNVIFSTFRGGLTSPTTINALQFASYRFSSQNDRTGLYWENQGVVNTRMWVDDSSNLRVSSGWPTSHNSGSVVGDQSSDIRIKNLLGHVEYGLSEILKLTPKKFSLKTEPDVEQIGFVAQDVLPIIPEAVIDTGDIIEGYENEGAKLGMRYVSIIPVLVNAIKEQQTIIESQQTQIDALTARIDTLENQ